MGLSRRSQRKDGSWALSSRRWRSVGSKLNIMPVVPKSRSFAPIDGRSMGFRKRLNARLFGADYYFTAGETSNKLLNRKAIVNIDGSLEETMESANDPGPNDDRRTFLKNCGKFAVVTPPAVTFLLSTSMSSKAIAASGGKGGGGGGGGGLLGLAVVGAEGAFIAGAP